MLRVEQKSRDAISNTGPTQRRDPSSADERTRAAAQVLLIQKPPCSNTTILGLCAAAVVLTGWAYASVAIRSFTESFAAYNSVCKLGWS